MAESLGAAEADANTGAGTGNVGDPVSHCAKDLHWIEIKLQDQDGKPIAGEDYVVMLPDGQTKEGQLDNDGFARIDSIPDAGNCKVCFPNIDSDLWRYDHSEASRRAET